MDNCFVTEDAGRHAPAGKKQPAQAKGYQVHMPPSKNIPLTVSDLTDAVRQSIRHEERATFVQICQLIEGCAMTEFAGLRRRVKKNYRFFSEAAMHRDMPTRKGRGRAHPLLRLPEARRARPAACCTPRRRPGHTVLC